MMEERGIRRGRGDDRRFSMPESGGGRRFSRSESSSANKDEEKVKSSKVRVYDKVSQPGKISPLMIIAALEKTINSLQQPIIEGVQQQSDLIQQYKYKLTELSLKKQNEMLQEELDSTKCLLEIQNQRAEESSVENVRLNKQVEELSKKIGQLHETHVKILHEKEEQRMEFDSRHAELKDQLSSLGAAKMFLEEETISLQSEVSLLAAAKVFLEEETNSLQSEMDRRTLVSEEEKVNLKGIIRELETALDSLNKDLESSRAMEENREGQIADLRHELLDNEEAKTCLKQKNNSLITEMNKYTEENALLEDRVRDLEIAKMFLEEKTNSLQSEVSSLAAAKMFLEEKTNTLQSEMDRRTLVSKEEKVNLKGTLRELENSLESVKKDLESSRAMEEKKEGQIVELRHQLVDLRHELLDNADSKTFLEQKNNSLITEMNKCTEENALLQGRIRELETAMNCLNKDLESKDDRLREMTERQSLQVKPHLLENGKAKSVHESENGKANGVHGKPTIDRKTPPKAAGEGKTQPKSTTEKRTPKQVVKERTAKQVAAKHSPNSGPEIPWR